MSTSLRLIFTGLLCYAALRVGAQQNPCGASNWGPLLSNDCGDIQASGGLAQGSPVIFCEGQTVIVENNSSPSAEIQRTYIDWGDGKCETFNNFQARMTHEYDFPNDTCIKSSDGTIVFSLRLGIQKSCPNNLRSFNFVNFPVKVRFKPVADFNANPSVACVNREIDFNNTSCENTNNPVYSWNMGNGTTFTTKNVSDFKYPTAGTYGVTLSVSNSCGTATANRVISVTPPATASAALSKYTACTGEVVTATNTSQNAVSFSWTVTPGTGATFANNTNRNSKEPAFRFDRAGTYTLKMTVGGCGDPVWDTTLTVLTPPALSRKKRVDDSCQDNVVVNPLDFFTIPTGITPEWIFTGGNPAIFSGATPPSVTFSGFGEKMIRVSAKNDCGEAIGADTFFILPPATAQAALSQKTLCGPDSLLTITANTSANATGFTWSFDPKDGASFANNTKAGDLRPAIRFTKEGLYTISLKVQGCGSPEWRDTVRVRLKPIVDVIKRVDDGCAAVTLKPTDVIRLSGGTPTSVEWTFGGGDPATFTGANPPEVRFAGFGVQSIAVKATNACGVSMQSDTFRISRADSTSLLAVAPLCNADTIIRLAAFPTGGQWSGTGVTVSGEFNPSKANLNQRNVLTYTVGAATCGVRDTVGILVRGTKVEAGPDLSQCSNAGSLTLTGFSPAGGDWSGKGVSANGRFDPKVAGIGTHPLTYTIVDQASGCRNTDTRNVAVLGVPTGRLDSVGRICVGVPFDFGPFGGGTGVSRCRWTFGDGQTSTDCKPKHTYRQPGRYNIVLIVQNAAECADTARVSIDVVTPPDATFTTDTTKGCADLPVAIRNTSSINNYTRYLWNYGDGRRDSLVQPGRIVFRQGEKDTTYIIALRSVNGCGEARAERQVTVFPRPIVRFGPDMTEGCTPFEVKFNNVSVGEPDFFAWYINGRKVSEARQLPQQTFLTGTRDSIYRIQLVATNECGMDTLQQRVRVKPNPVKAFFTPGPLRGCAPFRFRAVDFSTEGRIVEWDLGDGNRAAGDTVDYVYTKPGQYRVREFVNNGCGFDTAAVTVTVLPVPKLTYEHAPTVCLNDTLAFRVTSAEIAGAVWRFGDGAQDSARAGVRHRYTRVGRYTVVVKGFALTTGCPATDSSTVEVRALPEPQIQIVDTFGCQPFILRFNNRTPGANFYVWNYGNGVSQTTTDGIYTYDKPGAYRVSVQVTDAFRCKNTTDLGLVNVFPKPVADFAWDQVNLCQTPANIVFRQRSRDADAFSWRFGGGFGTSELANPALTVASAGTLPVTLVARNRFGCQDSVSKTPRIYIKPQLRVTVANQQGCDPFPVFFDNQSTGVNRFRWSFGDGGTSTLEKPLHIYRTPGRYVATLYASADSVCFDSLRLPAAINVLRSPVANFEIEPVQDTSVTPNGIFRFFDRSQEAIRWRWLFGDGDSSDIRNPTHQYDQNGVKVVQLVVFNSIGCPDTLRKNLEPEPFGGLYIPNVLAPEGGDDGVRLFTPTGVGLIEFDIAVYATNGQRIWHSQSLKEGAPDESWDGTFNGQPLPQGLYWWQARARFYSGRIWTGMRYGDDSPVLEGKVLLVR